MQITGIELRWMVFLWLVTGRGHLCITLSPLCLGIFNIYFFVYLFCRNSNMTSAKRWLNFYISPSLLCHLTFTTLPAVGKQGAGRKKPLYLGL